MNQKTLTIPEKVLNQNPLFWSGQGSIMVKNTHPNILIGIGIATPNQLSQALPFDVLGFLLSAEWIKRQLPNSQVFVQIGDQHAWLGNHLKKTKAKIIANQHLKIINQIIASLKLKNWHVFLSSTLFPNRLPASYQQLEAQDINHFINHHQVGIKIGWTFSPHASTHKTDEAHFDSHFNQRFSKLVHEIKFTSVFTRPGMTFNPQKPHESPYICTDPKTRIILAANKSVSSKLANKKITNNQLNAVKNHLKCICFLFEKLISPFPAKTPLEIKISRIIGCIFTK